MKPKAKARAVEEYEAQRRLYEDGKAVGKERQSVLSAELKEFRDNWDDLGKQYVRVCTIMEQLESALEGPQAHMKDGTYDIERLHKKYQAEFPAEMRMQEFLLMQMAYRRGREVTNVMEGCLRKFPEYGSGILALYSGKYRVIMVLCCFIMFYVAL